MNKKSHIIVGRILYDYFKNKHGIYLNKDSFMSGNIIPDYSSYAVIHPHFIQNSLEFIEQEIISLSEEYLESPYIGPEYSMRLGIICHYYADFFCYAHSRDFKQTVVGHIKYEKLLHQLSPSKTPSAKK